MILAYELKASIRCEPSVWVFGCFVLAIRSDCVYFYFEWAIGTLLFGLSLIKDVKRGIHSINEKANGDGNETEILVELCDSIQFQSGVRQLSIKF